MAIYKIALRARIGPRDLGSDTDTLRDRLRDSDRNSSLNLAQGRIVLVTNCYSSFVIDANFV